MINLLILHSTVDGHTQKICQFITDTIDKSETDVVIVHKALDDCSNTDIQNCDALILGASIRYGKYRKDVYDFIDNNKVTLANKHTGFFSVNLVARKAEKNTIQTNPYINKFLEEIEWKPAYVDVFAGCLDYSKYGLFDTIMIKIIMWLTKGPLYTENPVEFTNWEGVNTFALKFIKTIVKQ